MCVDGKCLQFSVTAGEQEWCLVLFLRLKKNYEGKCQMILVNQTLEITPA